ncbi:MAG TPA: ABC transporter ATP-binding protein [Mycobacteriales bacterium]|nr:ABC transporter ATP-binding protein [Mycobacteriales bacterium]
MTDAAVRVDGVSKRFRLYHERNQSLKAAIMRRGRASYEDFWALRDVSFEIPRGSTFGLVGTNGSGKSTLLKCIARILRPDEGAVAVDGKIAALLELGSGFHPELSGRENVYLNGSILGMSRREIEARFDDIVQFAGLERFIDSPVKNYSSGMYVRLGFSVAINVDPEVLLVDEVLAVGDAAFQRKCLEKFAEFRRAGKTVVIVSHDSGSMRNLCDEVAWLDGGRLLTTGSPFSVLDDYEDQSHEDRQETGDQSTRWGSGGAVIEKMELLGADGVPARRFRTGEQVTVRMHYRFDRPIDRPVFGYAIESLDGVYLWSQHSRHGRYVPERLSGRGTVDLAVPALALQPGTFDLTASIVDYQLAEQFDFWKHCLRFDVDHGPVREAGGYASLAGAWRDLRPEDGSEPAFVAVEPHPAELGAGQAAEPGEHEQAEPAEEPPAAVEG